MSIIFKAFFLSAIVLCFLNLNLSASAQEDDQPEQSPPMIRVPHSLNSLVFIKQSYFSDPNTNVTVSGFYKIIVSPFYSLETRKTDQIKCQDLLKNGIQKIESNYDFLFKSEEACIDLNEDNEPESVFWGQKSLTNSSSLSPFILTKNAEKEISTPEVVIGLGDKYWGQKIKYRPLLNKGWIHLVFLDFWNSNSSKITLRPASFDPDIRKYVPDTFSYNNDEVVFSTENKKLAYDFNFSNVSENSLVLNRSGRLMGYIHDEGVANTGFGVVYVATFDIERKKFRHIDFFKHPVFKKSVNQKYPGYLSRALNSNPGGDGNDPIDIKIIGFQNRDLIFKASVYSMNTKGNIDRKFCGYWKYNADTSNIALVSWNPSAAINVEHTGYVPEIVTD
ncbi:MAG: hypothetical protein AB7I41_20745 [Candidatus Sericytochromatia bacterium]